MDRDSNQQRYQRTIRGYLCGALVALGISCAAVDEMGDEANEGGRDVAESAITADSSKRTPKKLLRFVREFDVDGDGKLSAREVMGEKAHELLAAADANGDGKLSEGELRAWFSKKRATAAKKKKEKEEKKEIKLRKRSSYDQGEKHGR